MWRDDNNNLRVFCDGLHLFEEGTDKGDISENRYLAFDLLTFFLNHPAHHNLLSVFYVNEGANGTILGNRRVEIGEFNKITQGNLRDVQPNGASFGIFCLRFGNMGCNLDRNANRRIDEVIVKQRLRQIIS